MAGIAIVVLLRLPYLGAALGRDEGGDTMVALAYRPHAAFAYGTSFLDRPPLLLVLYGAAAALGGDLGVRLLGLLAASAAVAITAAIAASIGGRRAAPCAAIAAAVMVSSQATTAIYTPTELLAIVPSSASMLLVLRQLHARTPRREGLVAAGALAVIAIMIKQSFGDAAAAGVVGLAALALGGRRGRPPVPVRAMASSYVAGGAAVLLLLVVAAAATGTTASSLWYAILGFRLDAMHVLAHSQQDGGPLKLVAPALHSGLLVALAMAVAGIATAPTRTATKVALGAWLLGGSIAVVASGSNFAPYLIELVPVAAVGTGLLAARVPALGATALVLVAAYAVTPTVRAAADGSAGAVQQDARTIGSYVRDRAMPGQTAYVLYAGANVLYYTNLPSPFPYHWALMMRTVPHAPRQLGTLLDGPGRPTWIVRQQPTGAFGLDPSGSIRRSLRRHYRVVAHVCGRPVLLARGAPARPAPAVPSCRG